jgi:hypothetical protein
MNMAAISGATAGATAATTAAAAAAQQAMMEEEEMTPYSASDLDGWEFKILRTAGKTFRDPRRFEAALEEESKAGWELVEKFDDYRIRLKRPTEMRRRDSHLEFDPYRTWVGTTPGRVAGIVIGVVVFALLTIFAIVFAVTR